MRQRVHIKREGFGKQPALCGVRIENMIHGGPLTATCKRCLRAPGIASWGREAKATIAALRHPVKAVVSVKTGCGFCKRVFKRRTIEALGTALAAHWETCKGVKAAALRVRSEQPVKCPTA
jgi:hypothetical protein